MNFKKTITKSILLTTMLFSLGVQANQSSYSVMKEASQNSQESLDEGTELNSGVTFSRTERTPDFSTILVRTLKKLERQSTDSYLKALKDDEGFMHCTYKEAVENIRQCLPNGVLSIQERFIATYNGSVVGYAIVLNNNADAEIIQDGSWVVIYLDVNMNVIAVYRGQA